MSAVILVFNKYIFTSPAAQISTCTWKPWYYILNRSCYLFLSFLLSLFLYTLDNVLVPLDVLEHTHHIYDHVSHHNSLLSSNKKKNVHLFIYCIKNYKKLRFRPLSWSFFFFFFFFFWESLIWVESEDLKKKNGQFVTEENTRPIFCNFGISQMKHQTQKVSLVN